MMELCLCPQSGPGNVSCSESLLRGDRLMVVNQLNTSLEELWTNSACDSKSSNWKWFSERDTFCMYCWDSVCALLFDLLTPTHLTTEVRVQGQARATFIRAGSGHAGRCRGHTHTHVTLILNGLTLSTNHSSLGLSKIVEIVWGFCQ